MEIHNIYIKENPTTRSRKDNSKNSETSDDIMPTRHIHSKARCRSVVSRHIKRHMKRGMRKSQAIAVALSEARGKGCHIPFVRK